MAGSFFHSASCTGLVVLALAVNFSAATTAEWTVHTQPERLVNGSPVLFLITTPKPVDALSGSWMGHDVVFSYDSNREVWFALAGVGQETKPGSYSIALHAGTSARSSAGPSVGRTISFEMKIQVGQQQ